MVEALAHRGIALSFDFVYDPSRVAGDPAELAAWVLAASRGPIERAGLRIVASTSAVYDGSISPPGFSACHLLDSSHCAFHCYSDKGLVACDVFTCYGTEDGPERARAALAEIEAALRDRFSVPADDPRCARGEQLRFPTFSAPCP